MEVSCTTYILVLFYHELNTIYICTLTFNYYIASVLSTYELATTIKYGNNTVGWRKEMGEWGG